MMEGQNGNILPHKTTENGIKGKPPYSVETPYGFRLDLDFLKYVDDIEKGNTIKRVPIQRRSKGPRASTLPRHLSPSGSGYRPSPWGSTGALGPRSRLSDAHHHGYTSWANDHRLPLSPTGLKTLTEMEVRIKEFDEQPLGEHVRPNLLRASSLPLTVLLRQGSESTDDPGSLRSSRDHLEGRNTSCEDVFYSSDSPRAQDCSGLLRRLTEALERVGELEMEMRVIPELRAHICILQEERERLRLGLNPHITPHSMNGNTDPYTSSHGTVEIKRPRHESHIMFPRNHSVTQEDSNPTHEWRTSTDLDELLTVTSLQAKVAVLEQKLHETAMDLQRALGLLREQQDESRRKDEKIEHLITNPGMWVRAERVVVDQDGDEPYDNKVSKRPDAFISTRTVTTNGRRSRQQDSVVDSTERSPLSVEAGDASDDGIDTTMVVHHIKKIKRLLDQQWECLCADRESGEEGKPLRHPDPKVNSLQQEMMGLVDILTSYYTQHGHSDGERIQHGASKSIMRTDGCASTSKNVHSGGVNEGCKTTKSVEQDCVDQSKQKESSISPREVAAAQVDADPETRRMEGEKQTSPDRQMISGGAGSVRTDGGVASVEAEAAEKTAKTKPQPLGEQMEGDSGSETTTGGRETVSADFMTACQFLKDHMDNMDNPNDDMRKALVVVFQHWFSAAAEEASVASRLAVYLREVKKTTPSLLAFLVNLADDNGNTVLHYSVSHCNYSIVNLLLDTGVSDVNLQNNAGYTVVMLASLTAPDGPAGMEVVRKLMELGNVHIRSSQTGQTALHLAVRHGRVVMVRLLLSRGADANIQDSQGTTALMFASERGHTHIARLLLERSQCDLTLTDKRGRTALSIAMQGSHTDTAALLQAHAKARAF
ncbi:KN motif and ankyrin repeat domain-containing protein 4-like [Siniperca chuatsi]|uniref:KN motif and ankyrin repeat domain-containing protein 4-like n=1 Tax=Siniperca chuatsi TaxID=119488 RepID=UPI001CE11ABB|nr:KN motif and ankyrin repeat domain-containing protein 4-like [Siniperca chuatsi]XP_044076806.1 KN motif and ankyrin repeat domain-containing protein 4-like [Siniperca chuatsi]